MVRQDVDPALVSVVGAVVCDWVAAGGVSGYEVAPSQTVPSVCALRVGTLRLL